jgi:hypothetical protein
MNLSLQLGLKQRGDVGDMNKSVNAVCVYPYPTLKDARQKDAD